MNYQYTGLIAWPWLIVQSGAIVAQGPGNLFDRPQETYHEKCVQHFRDVKQSGWTVCPNGFATYSVYVDEGGGYFLILPGLKVRGLSKAQGKSVGLTVLADVKKVENHVTSVFEAIASIREGFEQSTRQNIHEVRGINNSLYNAAYELQGLLERSGHTHREGLAKNITAFSEILSARLDVISYLSNPAGESIDENPIPVYKRFDKMRMCFRASTFARNITLNLEGNSYGRIFGPDVLDIVTFLVFDNAVKYCLPRFEISITIEEDESRIFVRVQSVGPKIDDEEKEKIFHYGYRGTHARLSGTSGSGIGLPLLKRLVEHDLKGRLFLNIGRFRKTVREIPYHDIEFTFVFARYD